MEADPSRATRLLRRVRDGDRSATDELLPLVYGELRSAASRIMARALPNATLQPTALVHEAYLKLIQREAAEWNGRAHFFRVAVRAMRDILVDRARARGRLKREGDRSRVSLDLVLDAMEASVPDVVQFDEALRSLEQKDERLVRVVELRFFTGLSVEETAEVLGVSVATVGRDWRIARAFLRRELERHGPA